MLGDILRVGHDGFWILSFLVQHSLQDWWELEWRPGRSLFLHSWLLLAQNRPCLSRARGEGYVVHRRDASAVKPGRADLPSVGPGVCALRSGTGARAWR